MMYKLRMSIYKEFLLLRRDMGGVVVLFLMPLILIIAVTLIQDSTFKNTQNSGVPVLLVDNDNGSVSKEVFTNLKKNGAFSIITHIDGAKLTEAHAKAAVLKGKYQLAIVIPKNLSSDLQAKVDGNVKEILSKFGLEDSSAIPKPVPEKSKEVKLYFDPAVQLSFKSAVMSNVDKMISQIETKSIYSTFEQQLGEAGAEFKQESFITFKEMGTKTEARPNSVQHNVPAWTLFAIFFIVIPLSINIVKEKNLGTYIRSRTNPGSQTVVFFGKMITYLIICMIQFYMMIAVATYVFPHLNLPPLNVGGKLFLMSIVALFTGFAAIGFGFLLGTVAKTQEQSAPFGATSAIILAAIGGVWVPVFAMPPFMQVVARSSPMNWGLEAFYDVLLRNASIVSILPEIGLLFLFFIVTISIALLYDKKKRAV